MLHRLWGWAKKRPTRAIFVGAITLMLTTACHLVMIADSFLRIAISADSPRATPESRALLQTVAPFANGLLYADFGLAFVGFVLLMVAGWRGYRGLP